MQKPPVIKPDCVADPVSADVLCLRGDLSFDTLEDFWPQLCAVVRQQPPRQIDLSAVTHVDSSAVAMLLDLSQLLQRAPSLTHVPTKLQALMDVYGLGALLVAPAVPA